METSGDCIGLYCLFSHYICLCQEELWISYSFCGSNRIVWR